MDSNLSTHQKNHEQKFNYFYVVLIIILLGKKIKIKLIFIRIKNSDVNIKFITQSSMELINNSNVT